MEGIVLTIMVKGKNLIAIVVILGSYSVAKAIIMALLTTLDKWSYCHDKIDCM